MAYFLDTSILMRLANAADPSNAVAERAVFELHARGEILYITAQNLVEFRNAATRPKAVNGLGLSVTDVEVKAAIFESRFSLLQETPDIFPKWKSLVGALGIVGKQVHDARLVAVCHVNAVTHILTFNIQHSAQMAGFAPGIHVIDPKTV